MPEAEDAALKQVTSQGDPADDLQRRWASRPPKNVGALNYIGSDELTAGKAGGEFFGEDGETNVLCVNTLPGAANTEARCEGVARASSASGGESQASSPCRRRTSATRRPSRRRIKAALLKDDIIDGVVTIGTSDADSAASAIRAGRLGDKVKLGTFDMDETQLDRIKEGKQLFSIDQQPYLQGYLAVPDRCTATSSTASNCRRSRS